ncbi:MAG TPA: nitroreductase family protein [Acidimicrobiales bacterium]|nr:nitroreductase family protein [Acidimicrobiales bacterium]
MDVLEALYTTRAMRRLKPDPVPQEAIARIIDAGVRAPCPGPAGAQAWRFVAVTDRSVMAEIGSVWREARDALLERVPDLYPNEKQASSSRYLHDHFDEVPLLILGYGPEGLGANTVVQACWSMCLAARAQGLGSAYTTLLTQRAAAVDRILGVPEDAGVRLYAALPIGYPLGRWGVAPRQPAHEVTFADRWGRRPAWTAPPPPSA